MYVESKSFLNEMSDVLILLGTQRPISCPKV